MQSNKVLVSLVAGLGVLIIIAAGLLGFGFYRQSSDPGFKFLKPDPGAAAETPAGSQAPAAGRLALAAGERVRSVATAGGKIVVHVAGPDGDRILIVDPDSGRVLRRIGAGPGP